MPIELTDIPALDGAAKPEKVSLARLFRRRGIKASERMFFTERLALLLETGTSLYASLETIAGQVENPRLLEVAKALSEDVAGGAPFSEALSRHPTVFSASYVNLVGAGEQGGFMADVLKQLMEMEDKQARLRGTLVSALSYPVFLIFFSVAVVIFVLTVVFPKFADLFSSIADQLPVTTLVLMAASDVLRQYWLAILALGAAAGYAARHWLLTESGGATVDRWKLNAPLLKDVYAQLYVAQLMQVLGLSLAHGVSVVDALRASKDVVNNSLFRNLLDKVEAGVNEGQGIAAGFRDAEFVPDLVKQMIGTGEESGRLSLVMGRIAEFYQRELTRRLEVLSKLVEPVMLLVMGTVVGIIVSSLILPIFKLAHTVH